MATPNEQDLTNEIADDVDKYFQLQNLESKDRIALFRLAHDLSVSGFGGRQTLYERYFFGPPNVMHAIYFDLYNKDVVETFNNFFIERVFKFSCNFDNYGFVIFSTYYSSF